MRVAVLGVIAGVAFACVLLLAYGAWAHGQQAWVEKYSNGKISCCDKTDTKFISHAEANSLHLGDTVKVEFPLGVADGTIKRIFPTEDLRGRPVITRFGCLFKAFAM